MPVSGVDHLKSFITLIYHFKQYKNNEISCLPSKLKTGVIKPSNVPKAEPKPRVNNIRKNKTAQKGPPGITAIASATAINAKPVP